MQDTTSPDSRFDEAEADVDRGEPWRFREDGSPNPLTIKVTGWSSGHTKLGEAEFLNGVDRDGKAWSILVGSKVLQTRLIDGDVREWDAEAGEFVTVRTDGRAQPGEVISAKFLGDRESAGGFTYPDFAVVRKPPKTEDELREEFGF